MLLSQYITTLSQPYIKPLKKDSRRGRYYYILVKVVVKEDQLTYGPCLPTGAFLKIRFLLTITEAEGGQQECDRFDCHNYSSNTGLSKVL